MSKFIAKLDVCSTQPCSNGGFCNSIDGVTYSCKCKPGFEGENCEKRIEQEIKKSESLISDPCYSMPCFNYGKCLPVGSSFKCECEPGFYGTYCEAGIYIYIYICKCLI